MKSDSWKGMLFGLATFAVFSCGDTIIKYETQFHPVLECAFFAMIGGLGALLAQAARQGGIRRALASRNPGIQALRAFCIGVEFTLLVYGFSAMPMAMVYTLILSSPLLTAFFAPVFTSDRFNPRVLPAVLIGFAGVLIALRPGSMPVGWPSLAVLLAAFLFAFGNFIIRRMDKPEPPLTFAFYPSLFTLAVAGGFMILRHPPIPGLSDMLLMMVTGLCSVAGLTCLSKAMQLAPAAMVMPFHYTQLVWGALLGMIVFGDRMDSFMAAGALLILFSGLLLLLCGRPQAVSTAPAAEEA